MKYCMIYCRRGYTIYRIPNTKYLLVIGKPTYTAVTYFENSCNL